MLLYIPNTHIGKNAFCHCESLKKVFIPFELKNISDFMFSYCASLETIMLPKELKCILQLCLIEVNRYT